MLPIGITKSQTHLAACDELDVEAATV